MKGETVRWGNSLAVRIPKPAAQKARLSGEGQIELSYAQKVPALGRLVAQITELDRYAEIFRGLELRQGIRGVVTYVPEAGDITCRTFGTSLLLVTCLSRLAHPALRIAAQR